MAAYRHCLCLSAAHARYQFRLLDDLSHPKMVRANTMKTDMADAACKRLMCLGCGFSYDESLGLPEHGLAPGTRWKDIPDDWVFPDCGTPKDQFEMIVIGYASGGANLAGNA